MEKMQPRRFLSLLQIREGEGKGVSNWLTTSRTHVLHSGIGAPRKQASAPVQVSATSGPLQTKTMVHLTRFI